VLTCVSQKGNTPLHTASLAGKVDVAKILIDAGSNVNAQSQVGNCTGRPIVLLYLRLGLGVGYHHVCVFVCLLAK